MTCTINASASNNLQVNSDGSGVLKVQSNGVTTNALAWVNFNGSTAAIRSGYNISSVVRNGTGDYTLNFTTSMTDSNYAVIGVPGGNTAGPAMSSPNANTPTQTTTAVRIGVSSTTTYYDPSYVNLAIFGN